MRGGGFPREAIATRPRRRPFPGEQLRAEPLLQPGPRLAWQKGCEGTGRRHRREQRAVTPTLLMACTTCPSLFVGDTPHVPVFTLLRPRGGCGTALLLLVGFLFFWVGVGVA